MRIPVWAAVDSAVALAAFARTAWLFRVRGRRAVAQRAHASMRPRDPATIDTRTLRRCVRAMGRAAGWWPAHVSCLQRAFVLQDLLRLHGIPSVLRVGVRIEEGALDGHAWLDVGGVTVDPDGIQQSFAAFATAEARPR